MLGLGGQVELRILIDITHPAYAHFFRHIIPVLGEHGHQVKVTSRRKDVTVELLDAFGIEHQCLSVAGRTAWRLLWEMLRRVGRLQRVVRRFRPDVLLARDGLYASQAGWLSGVPAISFDDTDDAPLQHRLYFPFAWRVYTDHAYRKAIGRKQRFYRGVSCLAYLRPEVFRPDEAVLRRAGVPAGQPLIFCRLVSWTANHDYGQRGFDAAGLRRLLRRLSTRGRVVISSETPLDDDLDPYRLTLPPEQVHHLMAHCSLYVGESATMAAECAVLGVPAIHVSTRRLWYTDELEKRGLVSNVAADEACLNEALRVLDDPGYAEAHRRRRERYLGETDDLRSVVLAALREVEPLPRRAAGVV